MGKSKLLNLNGVTNPFDDQTHGGETGNLVAQPFRLNDRDLGADALVDVEVLGQAAIVLLDNDARCLLNGLGANATLKQG